MARAVRGQPGRHRQKPQPDHRRGAPARTVCGVREATGRRLPAARGRGGPAVAAAPASPAAAATGPVAAQPISAGSGAPAGSFQQCVISRESGGNAQVMNGSGHYGLYQFSYSAWAAAGGNPADFGMRPPPSRTRYSPRLTPRTALRRGRRTTAADTQPGGGLTARPGEQVTKGGHDRRTRSGGRRRRSPAPRPLRRVSLPRPGSPSTTTPVDRSLPAPAGARTRWRNRRPWFRPSRPSAQAPSHRSSTGSCAR